MKEYKSWMLNAVGPMFEGNDNSSRNEAFQFYLYRYHKKVDETTIFD